MKTEIWLILTLFSAACGSGDEPRMGSDNAPIEGAGMEGMQSMDSETAMDGMADMQMSGDGPIRITQRQAWLAGVTFALATEAPLAQTVRAVAMVVPNERGLGVVNARVSGWVEALHINETGAYVEVGTPLFDLYSPDLVTAQEELLLAKRLVHTSGGDALVSAARRRLELWDIPAEVAAEIEETGVAQRRVTILSPYRGNVLVKNVIEGQMVRVGERLFEIADLSTVWIEPAVFEQDIPLVRVGQRADITLDALPGRDVSGRITFVYPTLDMTTRTLRVRIEVPNGQGLIKPMMYGTVRIRTAGRRGVTVPLTAVLPTGERDIAFVWRNGGVMPIDVTVGARGDTTILVTGGLSAGDTVVASATFLFDSESSLGAAMAGIMLDMGMGLDMGGMDMGGMDMGRAGVDGMVMPDTMRRVGAADPMPGMPMDTGRGR